MISFIPLASSSSGNSTVIESHNAKVVVDMGITFGSFVKKINSFGICIDNINRLYISHAHSDHTKGLLVFLKKTSIPVYTRSKTKEVLLRKYPESKQLLEKINILSSKYCEVEDMKVSYFRLPHGGWLKSNADDAGEHIGFLFESAGYKLSFMTDLGHLTDTVKTIIKGCDAYVIESNYDHELQLNSSRPWGLKQRIMGEFGHLSNHQTANYLTEITNIDKTKKIFLAHLSRECNSPELAKQTVESRLKEHYSLESLPFEVVFGVDSRY